MDILIQKPTKTHPYICFNPVSMIYEISGYSFPEDPHEIFKPIFKWLDENLQNLNHKMELNIQSEYFNSVSNRLLLKVLRILETQVQAGKDIEIVWGYDDEDVENEGQIFSKLVNIPFRFVYKPFNPE